MNGVKLPNTATLTPLYTHVISSLSGGIVLLLANMSMILKYKYN